MAEDVRALIDHVELTKVDAMGYSMGARIAAYLALAHPERVRSLIFGGLGSRLVEGDGLPDSIAGALEAPSLEEVHDPVGKMFRSFAEQTGSDLTALAACLRGSRQTLTREEVSELRMPALVAIGEKDWIAGSAEKLAEMMPAGEALEISGRDHMSSVGDKAFKTGALSFLARRP